MKTINIEEALRQDKSFVDVRSPSEFKTDHVPGAVNIPLLDDQERDQVGKVYKKQGSKAARVLGFNLIGSRLPELVENISIVEEPVIYCWRGGLRSKSVVTLLELLGIEAYQLRGGYKAFRNLVNEFFQGPVPAGREYVVLSGLTGVGKTEILKELERLGACTVDLEEMANNRGSVFGAVGLGAQPTQKAFESSLFNIVHEGDGPYFIECESKRIGRVVIPDSVFQGMAKGRKVLIYDSVPRRVERILHEYLDRDRYSMKELEEAVSHLQPRLGKKKTGELIRELSEENYRPVVEYLLIKYYDPLYGYPDAPDDEYNFSIENRGPRITAETIFEHFQG